MGAPKRQRRPVGPKRSRAGPDPDSEVPHHLPFGHHEEARPEESPHDSLQDAFEHFFGGLGDFISALKERE